MRLAHVRSAGLRDMGYLSGSMPAGAIGPNHAREAMPVQVIAGAGVTPEAVRSGIGSRISRARSRIWRANSLIDAT